MRSALFGIALLGQLWGQTAPAQPETTSLVNTGAAIRLPFQCTNDDMDWAGMSCSEEEPCPVYLELASVEFVGSRLFVAGNIHSNSVTLYSVLLASDDAGKTWREPYDRMRGTVLDHIQFIDLEMGWVSGQVLVPVAQDPFLLITSDGGKTWRRRPVFGENRAGTISQFWFSSRTNGSMLIDRTQSGEEGRWEFYESLTGGESWMLRQVSDNPIRIKSGREPDPDWRIRADSAGKSFHIERRQREKWTSLASFLVPIGSCQPVQPQPAPEPATPAAAPEQEHTPAAAPKPRPSLRRAPK